MRDLVFVAFLLAMLGMGFRKPFLFVLTYVYIDVLSPQRLMYTGLASVPWSLIAFGLAILAWFMTDPKDDTRVAPRQGLMAALLLYCWYTTVRADFPIDAQDKWDWVWKALLFAIFLPLTLRTRLRIEALLLFMTLAVGAIIIVGGIKTLASGGGYGELNLMVDNNSGLFEGSTISTVAIAIIPVILWFAKFGTIYAPDWRVKLFAGALIFSCLLIPVGTSTRTGLLCIALLGLLMLRNVKRRFLYVSAAALVGLAAIPFLPSAFTERMETIKTYQADASASTRIAVWSWTLDYVTDHPFGGGFEAYRQNHIRYDKVKLAGDKNNATVQSELEIDKGRAYHSAYFEMLGEQGWPGLALWLLIQFGGLVRMEVLRRRHGREGDELEWAGALAGALQNAQIVYLLGAAFVGIAFQPFIFMLIGAQIGLDTYCGRKRAEAAWVPMRAVPAAA